jgi:hypothetical protein
MTGSDSNNCSADLDDGEVTSTASQENSIRFCLIEKTSNCPQSLTLFHFASVTENGCKNYWWLLICLQSVEIAFPEVAGHRAAWAASFPKPISLENLHPPAEVKAQAPKHS